MTNGEKFVAELKNDKYKKKTLRSNSEFLDGDDELFLYYFKRYISSCSCYLMNKRLEQKRRLYNGIELLVKPNNMDKAKVLIKQKNDLN